MCYAANCNVCDASCSLGLQLQFMCGNSSCKTASIARVHRAMYMLVHCACAQLVLVLEHARSRAHRMRRQFGTKLQTIRPAGLLAILKGAGQMLAQEEEWSLQWGRPVHARANDLRQIILE